MNNCVLDMMLIIKTLQHALVVLNPAKMILMIVMRTLLSSFLSLLSSYFAFCLLFCFCDSFALKVINCFLLYYIIKI